MYRLMKVNVVTAGLQEYGPTEGTFVINDADNACSILLGKNNSFL